MGNIESELGIDGVGVVTLNRPEKRNALSREMCRAIATEVRSLGADPGCVGIVLRAEGATFSAGADMSEPPLVLDPTWHWSSSETVEMYSALADSPVPTVAAVDSLAVGLGVGLLAQSTFVVASEEASFWLPEVSQGFFPYGAVQGLVRRVAPEAVVRWTLTTQRIGVAEAHAERLVTHVAPPGHTVGHARQLILSMSTAGRGLLVEAMRYLQFSHAAQGSTRVEAWCAERMTADVLIRRAANPPDVI